MNQDKAIFMRKCSALAHKNNEILIYILSTSWSSYLFVVPNLLKNNFSCTFVKNKGHIFL